VDGSENQVHPDLGYRIKILEPRAGYQDEVGWFRRAQSYGGERGVWVCLENARNAAKANGIKQGTYEVWRFHIGLSDSELPWFPPTKVYPE